jgi:signal transduction histidine kinase
MSKKNKKKVNGHFITMAALGFILTLLVSELVVYIFQMLTHNLITDIYVIMMYIIPSFSAVITAVLIYVNHRTLTITNRLVDGLNAIADGDYNVHIKYTKLDSFTAVYENFNKMAEELKSVKTLREDFVHDFSHEFKTPIASINGFANLLLDGGLSEEEQKQILHIIADQSARLSKLSESTLLLSRVENQQFIGDKTTYRLDTQLKDCVIMLEPSWEKKKININLNLIPIEYYGNETLLQQVWINILNNAIKFTPDGGEINVSATREGGKIEVKIADNGVGISESDLPKIFDKYFRSKQSAEGNGLGLPICKRIVDLSGGEISVTSTLGEGTTFIVRL